jgi:acyl carrier protein
MNREQITQTLTDVFRDVFDNPGLTVADTTTARDVEGWDSLHHIDLIVAAEKRFKVKFTTREVNGLANVGDFVSLIQKKLGG